MIHAVAIVGPTASGKSALGTELARRTGGEIVSIDSRQAYRGIDVGTAKPTPAERAEVPHHLIDILELHEHNDAESFAARANAAIRDIASRGRLPILVGGSGLYFRAVAQGFFRIDLDRAARVSFEQSVRGVSGSELFARLAAVDPESARRIHPNDRYRVVRALEVCTLTGVPLSEHFDRQAADPARREVRYLTVGMNPPRSELHRRIHERVARMFEAGWTDEVRGLLQSGADAAWPGLQTLGYPQVIACVRGTGGIDETRQRIIELTRQYAKRQMTWFRKEPEVQWLEAGDRDAAAHVLRLIRAEEP
jgi:tRNA dimethylallyltransferase